jgi:hypothetical protein
VSSIAVAWGFGDQNCRYEVRAEVGWYFIGGSGLHEGLGLRSDASHQTDGQRRVPVRLRRKEDEDA